MKEQFNEKTGRLTVKNKGFTFVVDGYESETVEAYNDKGKLPQFIREYVLSYSQLKEVDGLTFARWEMLCDLAYNLAHKAA